MEKEELRFRIPIPAVPPEEERVIPAALQTALLYKLLKSTREVAERLERVEAAVAPLKTSVCRLADFWIPDSLIDVTGRGCLKEFLIKSERSDFKVQAAVDGITVFSNPYSWFQEMSQYIEAISAFEKNGEFIFLITDLKFSKSLKLIVEPILPGKFKLKEVFWILDHTKV